MIQINKTIKNTDRIPFTDFSNAYNTIFMLSLWLTSLIERNTRKNSKKSIILKKNF